MQILRDAISEIVFYRNYYNFIQIILKWYTEEKIIINLQNFCLSKNRTMYIRNRIFHLKMRPLNDLF